MSDYDETLEIGIAAGLDVPTAMAIAQQDDEPPRRPSGCLGCLLVLLFCLGEAVCFFCR